MKNSLGVCFWLKIAHKITVKILTRATSNTKACLGLADQLPVWLSHNASGERPQLHAT